MTAPHLHDPAALPDLRIAPDELDREDVLDLLREHMEDMVATSPPESVHALSTRELAAPGVSFWTARDRRGVLLGCGALKALGRAAGEIKSMRTVGAARGRGVGAAVLEHLIEEARRRDYRALYLETGSQPFFAPARRLYAGAGFQETSPFGSYSLDPNSVYLVLRLH